VLPCIDLGLAWAVFWVEDPFLPVWVAADLLTGGCYRVAVLLEEEAALDP